MPPLITCRDLSISFGAEPLFEHVSLTVDEGDRLGLIGPNGAGKSTLLRILAGQVTPDSGERSVRKLAKSGYVPQDSLFEPGATVFERVREALESEPGDAVEKDTRAATALSQAGFTDFQMDASHLSGGWRKRLAITIELVCQPDVLLLDEPTNHLDLEGVEWLEKLLANGTFAFVAVSHDRYFLENVCQSMAEINRVYPTGLFRSPGNYSQFLEKREDYLATRAKFEESLAVQVRREVEWLRRGPKARTSKSRARIDKAYALMDELAEVSSRNRSQDQKAGIDFTATGRQTRKLIELRGVAKSIGGRTLFQEVHLKLSPGVRLGLVGPNGSGKTTLLRLFEGQLAPDHGTIERAEGLSIVYFDQNREQLDPAISLKRALAPEGDQVRYRDQAIHVNSWSRRFLFRTEQLEVPVSQLSGGERARVLIARLMTREADVLLLDEPTNDLDIPTLEVLEESLDTFPGALVLVTHDRFMLDRVSNAVLGLDGKGGAGLFADYRQWEAAVEEQKNAADDAERAAKAAQPAPATPAPARKRLSYLEKREWENMEDRIHQAEEHLSSLTLRLQAPEVVSDPHRMQEASNAVEQAQTEVDRLYERWAELEEKV